MEIIEEIRLEWEVGKSVIKHLKVESLKSKSPKTKRPIIKKVEIEDLKVVKLGSKVKRPEAEGLVAIKEEVIPKSE